MIYDEQHNRIETDRLLLRPFRLEDTDTVVDLCNNPILSKFTLSIPFPYDNSHFTTWLETHEHDFNKKIMFNYAITIKETEQLIGSISLSQQHRFRRGELGYWIGEPFWGEGYATEAAKAMVDFAFHHTNLNRIFAQHLLDNSASAKVMQKIGMIKEGQFKQHFYYNNQYHDAGYYAIVKEDYDASKI